jgi:hypothetical protein
MRNSTVFIQGLFMFLWSLCYTAITPWQN